ncbi:MFS transporter [Sphingomonas colocasiae]|uniref:MFS transporter n=1 Tax=Sphingomonas colocasiae TaxID=1848973 RepID=A0ABS7PKS8_9SPHN|nr:MFS transporter [Sphingomonas colocasiae]MBY8821905.1 MFS transporter [Sphingomonas colocasiae]
MACLPPALPAAPPFGDAPPPAGAVIRLVLLCTVLASAWAARSVFNPLQELARGDLSLDDVRIGLVQGAAMSIPSALLAIGLGRLIDTRNRVHILIVLALLTMLGSSATGLSTSFETLFAARALAGLGLLQETVVISLVADLFPPERRGRANILIVVGEYAGSALGFALAGWLMPLAGAIWSGDPGDGGWRAVQIGFGLLGLSTAIPLVWLREPARHECGAAAGAGFGESWSALMRMGALLWPLLIAQIAMIAANNAASVWSVSVFVRDFGLTPAHGGKLAAGAMFVPPLLGAAIAGVMADRLRIRGGGAVFVAVIAAAAAIPAALFPLAATPTLSAMLLALLMMAHAAAGLGGATLGVLAIPNELRGLWFGISNALTALISFALTPVLIGWLGESAGGAHALATVLAMVLLVAGTVALGGFALAWRALRG